MNLRQRILEVLSTEPERRFTNKELAQALQAPEPSVRRLTSQMAVNGQIQTTDFKVPFKVSAVPSPAPASL